ncbi:MAG: PD40 domain-containing protein, partial [Candidatus Marinimicrobia bacterium]|nr:PD40 domain-containing protein [Candidatus Neomarinimicrobiota bacterium]
MKALHLRMLIISFLIFFALSCEDMLWDNPNDANTTLKPSKWAPNNLALHALTDAKVKLTWQHDRKLIKGFIVERKTGNDSFQEIVIVAKDSLTSTDDGRRTGVKYTYRVRAYTDKNNSDYSNDTSIITEFAAPSNIQFQFINDSSIKINWQDNSTYETGFNIHRKAGNGDYIQISAVEENVNQYTDTGLTYGFDYEYRVQGKSEYNISEWLYSQNINMSIPAPTNLIATALNYTDILLEWIDNCDFEEGFRIDRQEDSGSWEQVGEFSPDVTQFTDTGLSYGITYSYRISAYTTSNQSGYAISNTVSTLFDPIPIPVNVISVVYSLDEMTVTWDESSDEDFKNYKILFSVSESSEKDTIAVYTNKQTTAHTLFDFDPTHENWFWIMVLDTFDQSSIGDGLTNDIDAFPMQINITSITYNIDEMVVTWEQSSDWDFVSYDLMYSESEVGEKTTISTIMDKTNTSSVITEFDPNHDNWFWVKVTDHWGQISIGNGYYVINNPPNQSELNLISYGNDSFYISWSKNEDDDFYLYQLFESLLDDMSGETNIYESGNREDTAYVVTGIGDNERKYYRLSVTDIFGLTTSSSIVAGSSFPKIVFVSDRVNDSQIYIMDTDGGNQTRLTNNTSYDDFDGLPQFSPDGSTVLFVSNRDGNAEIYIMGTDGRNQTRLTNNTSWDSYPQFSPNGSRVLFISNRDDNIHTEIYIMDTDGSNQTRLTAQNEGSGGPKFFPDGTKIAYQHHSYLANILNEIYIMDIDGGNKVRLTHNEYVDQLGEVSPDGTKIVFQSNRNGFNQIFLMNADGTEQMGLQDGVEPVFSSDGTKIAYRNNGIDLMNIDGTNPTSLTNEDAWRYSFSSDGLKMLFVSNREGNSGIYIMDIDGSNQTNLSNNGKSRNIRTPFRKFFGHHS